MAEKLAKKWNLSSRDKAWCVKCESFCGRWPPRRPGTLHMKIAATICVGMSSMGSGWGWLDDSAIATFVWIQAMKVVRPNVIVHECVQSFDATKLRTLLGNQEFKVAIVVFSTNDWGCPHRQVTPLHCDWSPTNNGRDRTVYCGNVRRRVVLSACGGRRQHVLRDRSRLCIRRATGQAAQCTPKHSDMKRHFDHG